MERQAFFNPFFGSPFFPQFGHFGFPRRRFFPFFFFSPFFFPFFFRGDERDGAMYTTHHCQHGDTMESLAEMYNVPKSVLETFNPHVMGQDILTPGTRIQVPRLNRMNVHRMYLEVEDGPMSNVSPTAFTTSNVSPGAFAAPNVSPTAFTTSNVSPGAFAAPNVSPTAFTTSNVSPGAFAAPNVSPTAFTMSNVSPGAFAAPNVSPTAYGDMTQASQAAVWPDGMQTASYYPWSQMTDSSPSWMTTAHDGFKQTAKDTKDKRTSEQQDTLSTEEQEADFDC
jgi:LysM repeat protein